MADLIVGCPVRRRHWIMDRWFTHVEDACGQAGLAAQYIFVVDPDDPTFPILERWSKFTDMELVLVEEDAMSDAELRRWDQRHRLEHMVEVRNLLLAAVRLEAPRLFWSLDSDILPAPTSLASAVSLLDTGYAAVASLTWMHSVGLQWPNWGLWDPRNGGMRRMATGAGGRYACDIIMAAKLMSPAAYEVDYSYHADGEDVAWSLACKERGLALGVDGMAPVKHVMGEQMLGQVDQRIGW